MHSDSPLSFSLTLAVILLAATIAAKLVLGPLAEWTSFFGRGDFAPPYAASTLLRDRPHPDLYSREVSKKVKEIRAQRGGLRYLYPPSYAMLLTPLTAVEYIPASRLWIAFNGALLGVSLVLLIRIMRRPLRSVASWLPLLAIAAYSHPIYLIFESGQTNLVIFALVLASVYWSERRRNVGAGAALGVAMIIKAFPVVLVPYFALRKRYWLVTAAILAVAGLTAVSVLSGNGALERKYYTKVLPQLAVTGIHEKTGSLDNKTINGTLHRGLSTAGNSYAPLVALPEWAIQSLRWTVAGACLSIGTWLVLRRQRRDWYSHLLEISLVLTVVLLAASYIHGQFLAFLMLPFAVLLLRPRAVELPQRTSVLLLVAIVITQMPNGVLENIDLLKTVPGGGVLATPQTFGMLLLLWVIIEALRRHEPNTQGHDDTPRLALR